MNIFVKLGDNAHSFSDPISGFSIVKGEVLILDDRSQKSQKVKSALKGGHLVRSSKSEFDDFKTVMGIKQKTVIDNSNEKELKELLKAEKEKNALLMAKLDELSVQKEVDDKKDQSNLIEFSSMSDDELVNYYSETFDVTAKQVSAFKKLSKDEKVAQLEKLEE